MELKEKLESIVTSRDEVFKRLYFVLVGEGYKHSRGNVLYKPIADGLELQYKIDISDVVSDSNIIVFDNFPDRYESTVEELEDVAFNNTVKNHKARFESVCDILGGILEGFDLPLFCLTNEKKVFGAGTILYPGMKEKIESVIGDFIIIPSSVHEVLVLPSALGERESIASIIREVNRSVVEPEEVLSDRPYILVTDGVLIEG